MQANEVNAGLQVTQNQRRLRTCAFSLTHVLSQRRVAGHDSCVALCGHRLPADELAGPGQHCLATFKADGRIRHAPLTVFDRNQFHGVKAFQTRRIDAAHAGKPVAVGQRAQIGSSGVDLQIAHDFVELFIA